MLVLGRDLRVELTNEFIVFKNCYIASYKYLLREELEVSQFEFLLKANQRAQSLRTYVALKT